MKSPTSPQRGAPRAWWKVAAQLVLTGKSPLTARNVAHHMLRGALSSSLILGALTLSGALPVLGVAANLQLIHPHPPALRDMISQGLSAQRAAAGQTYVSERARQKALRNALIEGMLSSAHDEYTGLIHLDSTRDDAEAYGAQEAAAEAATARQIEQRGVTTQPPEYTPSTVPRKDTVPGKEHAARLQVTESSSNSADQPQRTSSAAVATEITKKHTADTTGPPHATSASGAPGPTMPANASGAPGLAIPARTPVRQEVPLISERWPTEALTSGWSVTGSVLSVQIPTATRRIRVGILRVPQVEDNLSSEEARRQLQWMHSAGAEALVIDLQDCPGGQVRQASAIAGMLLPRESLFAVLNNGWKRQKIYTDQVPMNAARWPRVTVQDGYTASACEMISGALSDNGTLTLGEPSYGKGSTQGTLKLEEDTLAAISQGQWFTPAGRSPGHRRGPWAGHHQDIGLPVDITVQGTRSERIERAITVAAQLRWAELQASRDHLSPRYAKQ